MTAPQDGAGVPAADAPAPGAGTAASAGNAPVPGNPKATISRPGAIFRLVLSCAITFGVAIQAVHTGGQPINFWAYFGAALLTAKELQSYISQTWSNAFGQAPGPSAGDSNNAAP